MRCQTFQNGRWRYIEDDNVSAGFGLAADEYLAAGSRPDKTPYNGTLRLYTYKSHCALVGRFQDIEKELHLEECRSRGVTVNRRSTGGGAILMGEGQLGIAVVSPITAATGGSLARSTALFETYSKGIVIGLRRLGIEAEFRPKNDLLVNGRKIAGLALFAGDDNNVLFHASVLLDMDIPLMLSVLNVSQEKLSGKGISNAGERVTTVSAELGGDSSMRELRVAIKSGFQEALAVEFEHEPFSAEEVAVIGELEERKYNTHGWIHCGDDA